MASLREIAMTDNRRSHDIQEIANQTGFPETVVEQLYDEVLQILSKKALIQDYLHLLTCKHVRQHLKLRLRAERQNHLFNQDDVA